MSCDERSNTYRTNRQAEGRAFTTTDKETDSHCVYTYVRTDTQKVYHHRETDEAHTAIATTTYIIETDR